MYKKFALILISIFISACATSTLTATSTVVPAATSFTPLSRGTHLPLMYQPINTDTAASVTLLSRWNAEAWAKPQSLVFMQNDNTLLVGSDLLYIKDGSPDYSYSRQPYWLGINSNSPFNSPSPWVANSPDGKFNVEDYFVSGIFIVDRNLETNWRWNYRHVEGSTGILFTPDSRYLVIGINTGEIWFVPTKDWGAKFFNDTYDVHPEHVIDVNATPEDIAFSPDASTMAVATKDHTIQIWDVASLSYRLTIKNIDKSTNLVFSPDGQIIAAGLTDRQIGLWDTHNGQPIARLQGSKGILRSIAFSPSSLFLASLDDKEGVLVWGILPHSNSPAAANTATAISRRFLLTSTPLATLLPTATSTPTDLELFDEKIQFLFGEPASNVIDFFTKIQDCVRTDNKEQLASLILYPITIHSIDRKDVEIKNEKEFIANYEKIAIPKWKAVVLAQVPTKLFANWRGIMVNRGEIWFGQICLETPPKCEHRKYYITTIINDTPW